MAGNGVNGEGSFLLTVDIDLFRAEPCLAWALTMASSRIIFLSVYSFYILY